MKKFDVILFDSDDTLFDFQKSEKYNLNKTFHDFGINTNNEIETEYNRINKEMWEEYNKGNITKKQLKITRFDILFNKFNIVCDSNDFNEAYLKNLAENSFLMDDAENICELLSKEFKLVIVTNAVSAVAHRKIEKSDINKYISDIFVSDDIGFQKPRVEFFNYVFSHLKNIDKDRMILVGDSLTSDIQGGINAEIKNCWFNQFNIENKTNIIPTYEINKLEDLFPIVGYNRK